MNNSLRCPLTLLAVTMGALTVIVGPVLAKRGLSIPPAERRYYAADSSGCVVYEYQRWNGTTLAGTRAFALRRTDHRTWDTLWVAPQAPGVGPRSALVARAAHYVVSFGSYEERDFESGDGRGDSVVVIRGPSGEIIRSLGLVDFVPHASSDPDSAARRKRSGIWVEDASVSYWGSGHRIEDDDHILVLRVIPDAPLHAAAADHHQEVRIDLATGRVLSDLGVRSPAAARGQWRHHRWPIL